MFSIISALPRKYLRYVHLQIERAQNGDKLSFHLTNKMTLKTRKFYFSEDLQKVEVLATKEESSFVHFVGKDKRFDKWIPTATLGPQIPPEELPLMKTLPSDEEAADVPLVRNIEVIYIHNYKIDCWYYSPYPFPDEVCMELWICGRCLRYHPVEGQLGKHLKTCKNNTPGILDLKIKVT